ncbi:MAG TPA: hypothetical protein VH640_29915 [Bryobacteraceae bacterium]
MRDQSQIVPAFEKQFEPAISRPAAQPAEFGGHRLEISVVFTSPEFTLTALRRAATLAGNLGAYITLIVPQVVPFPLPLTSPPVLLDFQEARLREIASNTPVETLVRIYLCRSRWELLQTVLEPHSLVVLGARMQWSWLTHERRLARKLRRVGHEVVMAEMG